MLHVLKTYFYVSLSEINNYMYMMQGQSRYPDECHTGEIN